MTAHHDLTELVSASAIPSSFHILKSDSDVSLTSIQATSFQTHVFPMDSPEQAALGTIFAL